MAYSRHVLEERSSNNTVLVLEGKVNGVSTGGRSRSTWIGDIKE